MKNRFQEIRKDNKIQFWGFLATQIVSDKHNLNESSEDQTLIIIRKKNSHRGIIKWPVLARIISQIKRLKCKSWETIRYKIIQLVNNSPKNYSICENIGIFNIRIYELDVLESFKIPNQIVSLNIMFLPFKNIFNP